MKNHNDHICVEFSVMLLKVPYLISSNSEYYINTDKITHFCVQVYKPYYPKICFTFSDENELSFEFDTEENMRKFINDELIPTFNNHNNNNISKLNEKVIELETIIKYLPGIGTEYQKAHGEFVSLAKDHE